MPPEAGVVGPLLAIAFILGTAIFRSLSERSGQVPASILTNSVANDPNRSFFAQWTHPTADHKLSNNSRWDGAIFMAKARVERRLAAILAADVAGYSRLMGTDEEGTLAALKTLRRELIDPKIAEHRGRIVKTTGDGALVEFASAVDAVRCAMEIQRAMAERNAAVPEDRRIEFRIGINVGDIIIDEGDIYGDGVN